MSGKGEEEGYIYTRTLYEMPGVLRPTRAIQPIGRAHSHCHSNSIMRR